jgi:hypothetical protein
MSHQSQPPTCWSKMSNSARPVRRIVEVDQTHAKTRKLFVVRDSLAQNNIDWWTGMSKISCRGGGVENVMETWQGWRGVRNWVVDSFILNESINGCRWVTSNPADQLVARPSSSAMTVVNWLHHSQSLANTFRGMRRGWWADVSFSRISVS